MRFDVEKYDRRINFGLWQVQVKDVLIQSGLHKALKGKPAPVSSKESSAAGKDDDEEWDDLDLRVASAIRLSLAKNVLANLYQGKGISNRLYLKEQFHTLRMNGDTKISDHLSVLNNIVSELEAIGVKVEDEDKALRLILSLPSSYEHMKPILMYGKETLKYADVTGKLLSEEKRLESSGHTSSSEEMFLVSGKGKKKFSQKTPVCWRCGKTGHVKRNCPDGADSQVFDMYRGEILRMVYSKWRYSLCGPRCISGSGGVSKPVETEDESVAVLTTAESVAGLATAELELVGASTGPSST
ncbi:hypothetical protein LXL04_002209 [Taraxacum kok-saghyz]